MSASGIYVHIPFCRSKCAYCDFVSVCEGEEKQRLYINALLREINTGRKIFDGVADTLYIGGGTPSCLYDGAVESIVGALGDSFDLRLSEFSVECNPDTFTPEKAEELKKAGVTRISLGVQSLDDGVLKKAGRRHDAVTAMQAVRLAVKSGFDVSADLMLGLEGQREDDVDAFVGFMSREGVKHVSAYMLKVESGTPLARAVEKGLILPSDDDCAELYDRAVSRLKENGFCRYETSNFCKEGKVCRHNMKYWKMCDYLGFGVAAHGKLGRVRYYNDDDVDGYIRAVLQGTHAYRTEEVLDRDEELKEYVMLGLRLEDGVDVEEAERLFCIDFAERFSEGLKKAEKYVLYDGKNLRIRPEYALVANSVINMFV